MKFQKGHKTNLGKHWKNSPMSEEHKEKIRETHKKIGVGKWNKGKKPYKMTEEIRKKISEVKKGIVSPRKGVKLTDETKEKISLSKKGEKNYNWKGGISKNPYPKEFNTELRLKIRTRDNFICCLCGRTEREELEELNQVLAVNHIDFNKNNNKEENLNTLCCRCNVKINRERDYWTNYFNRITKY